MPVLRSIYSCLAALCLLVGLAVAPSSARAEMALSGLEGLVNINVVDDESLADMRGKFVTASGISYFGLDMQSRWEGPDGVVTAARMVLSFDLAGSGGSARNVTPQIHIIWKRDEADTAMDVSGAPKSFASSTAPTLAPVGGLGSVNGAVQSQLIAGSDNSVRNVMTIAISPNQRDRPDTAGLTPITTGSTQRFGDGDTVSFLVSGSAVGIQMTGGNSDSLQQGVNSSLNQLGQQVSINTSHNTIQNSLGLTIGIDPTAQAGAINAANAMSAMRGNGF